LNREEYLPLCDAIVNSVKAPFKRFNRVPPSEEFWELKGCAAMGLERGAGCHPYIGV
jgi:hypothetical protein